MSEATPNDLVLRDLERQAAWVPAEVKVAIADATANAAGQGIHKTQLDALGILMDVLGARVDAELDALRTATDDAARGKATRRLLVQIVARAEVWQIFRTSLALRRNPVFEAALDTADLVAARAYRMLQDRAQEWGKLPGRRAPPLVVLRAAPGAASATADDTLGDLADGGFVLRRYRDEALPIPIVLLSADQCGSVWRYTLVFHEVGHLLDRDVGASRALTARAAETGALAAGVAPRIRRWASEIVADVVGLSLGGEAFLGSMTCDLFAALVGSEALDDDDHPNPWIRIPLLFELAVRLKISPSPALALLRDAVVAKPQPPWVVDFAPHLPAIASFFVDTRVDALGGHALTELPRPWSEKAGAVEALTSYLAKAKQGGRLLKPAELGILHDHELVPIAAEKARLGSTTAWADIHDEALDVAQKRLERPKQLALNGIQNPMEYFRQLARDFAARDRDGEPR